MNDVMKATMDVETPIMRKQTPSNVSELTLLRFVNQPPSTRPSVPAPFKTYMLVCSFVYSSLLNLITFQHI